MASAFGSVENRLPGRTASPTQRVAQFQNQQLAGLSAGLSSKVGQATPQNEMLMNGGQQNEVMQSLGRTQDAVRNASTKLVGYAQIQRNRVESDRARAEQARLDAKKRQQPKWQMSFSGGSSPQMFTRGRVTQMPRQRQTSGTAVHRIQSLLPQFPGLRITEIGGNRAYDLAHGVPRWSGSYHYDTKNPAVDIAGPTDQLDRLYRELKRQGKWRQILWRVPNHYDHIHVA